MTKKKSFGPLEVRLPLHSKSEVLDALGGSSAGRDEMFLETALRTSTSVELRMYCFNCSQEQAGHLSVKKARKLARWLLDNLD